MLGAAAFCLSALGRIVLTSVSYCFFPRADLILLVSQLMGLATVDWLNVEDRPVSFFGSSLSERNKQNENLIKMGANK